MPKKLMCVVASLLLLASLLCGCATKDAPVTTEALLARCISNGNMDNLHADARLNFNVSVGATRVGIPLVASADVCGNVLHGTVTASLQSLDIDDYSVEVYVEQIDGAILCYLGTGSKDADKTWKCYTASTTSSVDLPALVDLLKASELTRVSISTDDQVAYELTVPLTDVVKSVMDNLKIEFDHSGGTSKHDLMSDIADEKVTVDFTEDCAIRSISASAMFDYKAADAKALTMTYDLDLTCTLTGYGSIDAASVAVPQAVRDAAVPVTDAKDLLDLSAITISFA